MSPSDKNEATNTDSKEDSHINQESMKSNGIDTFPIELSSSSSSSSCSSSTSSSSSSCMSSATEHGTITNIPSLTAKISTLKCSDNDQMKTFDPGETGNIDNANSKQCGYSLFPLKNSNTIAKSNKNYKAGSKINKLADMLAKRSQNIVEMTQNVTLDVVTDIISAPKVESNSPVDISEIAKSEDYKVDVCSEKTQEPFNCINERQIKSVSNENSDTVKKLKTHSFSDISEEISQETCVSEFNALKEHLVKSETDGSTKNKEEVKKNVKNLEHSLMSEKKRSSPRTRLVCSEVNKQPLSGIEKHKSDKNVDLQLSASTNLQKRPDKSKSGKQKKSKRLVETSTQTSTTDFVYLDAARCEAEPGSSSGLQPAAESESEAGESAVKQESTAEKLEVPDQHLCEEEFTENQLLEENSDVTAPKKLPEFTEKLECETDPETEEKSDETLESEKAYKFVYACMYCPASFVSRTDCKQHEKSHSPKKNKQNIKCQFCVRRFQSFSDLKSHCYKNHPNKYAYCVKCDDRFCEKSQLYEHNKLLHLTKAMETAQTLVIIQETLGINPKEKTKEEIEEIKKSMDKKSSKPTATKSDLKVDVSFDNGKKSTSPRTIVSPRETKTEEQLLEMEMLFYSHLSGNIKENLTNHLDGKIDKSVNPVQTDLGSDSSENSQAKVKNATLLSVATTDSNSTPEQMLRAPSPYQTRSKTPNPLPPTAKKFKKLPNWQQKFWEKYNFPTNYRYEHRFWDKNYLDTEKSAFYLKDLSCLDIKTQLIMRENMKKLDIIKNEETNKSDKLTFPEYLSLVPKVPDGNSQKNDGEVSDFDGSNKNQCNKDDKKPTRITVSDLSKSRKKTSAESPVSKRGAEKNTNRNSDGTKMMTRRQSVIELKKIEDTGKRRKGSLDVSDTPRMTLRRQTSLDNLQRICSLENSTNNKVSNYISPESDVNENESEENLSSSPTGFAEISGEWVRPRSYLCGTCCAKFTNLWELEDHKWVSHPNVWCTHYEFEDEKIDKLFHRSEVENAADNPSEDDSALSKLKLTDLYKRYLLPHGSLKTAKLVPNVSFPEQCTKCNKNCMSLPELHKHMLDCGGDTTWFLTMYSSPMSIKRRWRPFGSRRRKQIGRRVLKRNIPNTSNIRSYHYQHRIRTKPGDVESIQKMLANLPEKRARRAINFDKEIKTRSQATIRSNRILRKRFKVSFGTNMLRLKALKQQKQVKVKKEISSKSTTDTSSENSPTGSPKRKNKQKDNIQLMKEENIVLESMSSFEEEDDKKKVLKQKSKKKESSPKKESTKKEPKKESSKKCKKSCVKSNSTVTGECAKEINSRDKKKKIQPTGLESAPKKDAVEASSGDAKSKKNKSSKSPKKKPTQKDASSGKQLKKDLIQIDLNASPKETPAEKKMKTDVEEEKIIEQISEVTKESKKGKKGESPGKNVLRLKSNDKEKTELIKRIQKTLKNSKKILEKKEIKDQDDRRRSLRIQTLQLTDSPRANEDISSLDKDLKELKDTEIKRSKSPLLTLEKDAFAKKTSKVMKSPKIDYFTVHHNEIAPPIRRSSRNSLGSLTDIKSEISDVSAEKDASNITKTPDSYQNISLEANQSELADTIKRSPVNESLRDAKTPENNSDLIGFEYESIRKGGRFQNTKNDMESQVKPSQNIKDTPLNRELAEVNTENLQNDLEMPVLAKEDTSSIVRGRATRKSESEIPVLMPYVNSETVSRNSEELKAGKRKGVVTFKVVNKKHKSTEKLNSLKIVKETNTVPQVENASNSKSKEYVAEESNDGKLKKRKRFDTSEPASVECPLPKTPKVKKYFLGICPNEIDKGGDEKDESGSDSEPLITLLINQKEKMKTPASHTLQEVEQPNTVEVSGAPPIKNIKKETSAALVPKKKKPKSKKESRKKEKKDVPGSNEINKTFLPVTKTEENKEENEEIDSAETGQEKLSLETSQTEMETSDEFETKKHVRVKKSLKGLKMTVKLKESDLKILDNTSKSSLEINEQISEAQVENETKKVERRSRRVSKEVKSTNEFVIDDPLILVDELWSDLDSDSDGSRKRSKKNKKKSAKKKMHEEKRESSVNLEELLRNFGESKNCDTKLDSGPKKLCIKLKLDRKKRKILSNVDKRKQLEDRFLFEERSHKRLSLRLFKFHRKVENFGNLGLKLLKKEDIALGEPNTDVKSVPTLPFLAAEIKENPVQIIQCGTQKPKPQKKSGRKSDFKLNQNMQLKISLPLQNINNLAVLNNNHLTEVGEVDLSKTQDIPDVSPIINKTSNNFSPIKIEDIVEPVGIVQKEEESDPKLKSRRSEIIDKIFYCEICKTYYYSSSQLKIHKLSNRHKQKECELLQPEKQPEMFSEVAPTEEMDVQTAEPAKTVEEGGKEELAENIDAEKINDDTSEMPILEGPFIENPFVRLGIDPVEPPQKPSPPSSNMFGFTEDCLKDIQKAIGCTDEEMLILTLLGENSIEIENDILDLDSCQPVTPNAGDVKTQNVEEVREKENSNGLFKLDFKKRITSALARLVNKAVLNLLQKYKSTHRIGISPEALSFLIRLSKVNNKKNLLELDELLKNENEGESSNRTFANEEEKREHSVPYKYLCSICDARFQKESTMEWHVIRSHRSKGTRDAEDLSSEPVTNEEEKEEETLPYKYLCTFCGARFQKESIKECHIIRAHRNRMTKNTDEPSSSPGFTKEDDKKEHNTPYKYLCTICGSRFQKESMWECHIKRSHKTKAKKNVEEMQVAQTTYEEDWNTTWTYDIHDELPGSVETPQFLCSDCGINFTSPQEVLEHQKLEHSSPKDGETNESGPLQSSTIGSSDEIIKGKKAPRRGPKHLTKAELDQQMIIANNELKKLDRKFSSKSKSNRVKWGVDALKFTVEKENKAVPEPEDSTESLKHQMDPKNLDVVPKINLSRTSSLPEFKVTQKATCLNRFQRILDNKMKRKSVKNDAKEAEEKEADKTFLEPEVIVRRERKRKQNKCSLKKDDDRKVFDVYDFNDSESEPEPVAFSHVKRVGPPQSPTKLKLVKVKDATETEKNKADSTTKDLETEDYDSEDSLPLSVVKKSKAEEDEEEIRGENQVDKSEGILEQVEYLIEQLENETNNPKSKEQESEKDTDKEGSPKVVKPTSKGNGGAKSDVEDEEEESIDSQPETFRISLENKFLHLENIAMGKKNEEVDETIYDLQESPSSNDKPTETTESKEEEILPVADSSQGMSDEEDSIPLVLMSKKNDDPDFAQKSIKNISEIHRESSFVRLDEFGIEVGDEEDEEDEVDKIPPETDADDSSKICTGSSASNGNEEQSDKIDKSFETVNGNVIYRRNDSMSGFDSDLSDYETISSNLERKNTSPKIEESLIKEVMEKEDVVIVCSKKEQDVSKSGKKKPKEPGRKRKQITETVQRKKKILPLLSVTLEENKFRKSESPKLKKDVIMKKIWSRRRPLEDVADDISESSLNSRDNDLFENSLNDDSHSEIDKEIIMKKIWNKKRLEHDNESGEVQVTSKQEDIKINQTEISDEVVIRCGPKAKPPTKRRKSRNSPKESSKERIMRKIWSGKCTFQTKAALKTYESDILNSSKESDSFEEQNRVKKRGRPSNFLNSKKTKILSDGEKSDEDDDLDSLLEEIEREEVEKAIRLEFLQLRRSDKASAEVSREGNKTVGLFAETCQKQSKDIADRRRKRIKKNIKHPRKHLLKRRTFIKKPIVKPQTEGEEERISGPVEDRLKADTETSDVVNESRKPFDLESKIRNRKHKKHRHKHHHHKHKHKKSKHRKYIIGRHKIKHKEDKTDEFENFSILEKMCQEIPNEIEKQTQKRFASELDNLDTKLDEILMSTSSSFDGKTKECEDVFYEGRRIDTDRNYGIESEHIYDFVDDDSGFLCESKGRHKN